MFICLKTIPGNAGIFYVGGFASGTREEIHILYVEKLIESHFAIV